MRWKRTNSKHVFSHPRLNIYIDDVELPSGYKTDYLHFGEQGDAAMIIPLRNDGKVLVQKEYSYPPNEILYQFPGGAIEDGEDVIAGALRELSEETKLTGTLESIGKFYLNNRRSRNFMHVYTATNLKSSAAKADAEELFEDYWLTEKEIDELIKSGEFLTATGLAGWALYKNSV